MLLYLLSRFNKVIVWQRNWPDVRSGQCLSTCVPFSIIPCSMFLLSNKLQCNHWACPLPGYCELILVIDTALCQTSCPLKTVYYWRSYRKEDITDIHQQQDCKAMHESTWWMQYEEMTRSIFCHRQKRCSRKGIMDKLSHHFTGQCHDLAFPSHSDIKLMCTCLW